MVEHHIAARGVRSDNVLNAMRKVPREAFLPRDLQEFAYEDAPLPIAEGQTISQPYIVALMVEALALEGGEKVLEIGAGSGYAAAVLAEIASEVYTVERIGQLAEKAAAALAEQGYDNVHVLHGDGTRGWPEHAPYDAIVVAAGGPKIPESLAHAAQDRRPAGDSGRQRRARAGTGARHARLRKRIQARRSRRRALRAAARPGRLGAGDAGARAAARHQLRASSRWSGRSPQAAEPFDSIETRRSVSRCSTASAMPASSCSAKPRHGTSEFYRMREASRAS